MIDTYQFRDGNDGHDAHDGCGARFLTSIMIPCRDKQETKTFLTNQRLHKPSPPQRTQAAFRPDRRMNRSVRQSVGR